MRLTHGCLLLAALLAPGTVLGSIDPDDSPSYFSVFDDAITGDNSFTSGTHTYWTIDPGADSYQDNIYERPVYYAYTGHHCGGCTPNGKPVPFKKYLGYIDIEEVRVGWDDAYLYIAIDMYSRDKQYGSYAYEKGMNGLYGFQFSDDPDGRDGYLFSTYKPEYEHGTTWGLDENEGYWDTDGDVGGRGLINGTPPSGLSVTKTDNSKEGLNLNGHDEQIVEDGLIESGLPNEHEPVLYSRLSPTDDTVVELALAHRTLFGPDSLDALQGIQFFDAFAIKGGPKNPEYFLFNDKYTLAEAGSPYNKCNPPDKIYKLDTVRGGPFYQPIPEPSTYLLIGTGLVALLFTRRRFVRRKRAEQTPEA